PINVRSFFGVLHKPVEYVKQAIHISSEMEFLEHWKEKAIVKIENLWNLEQMIQNDGIQTNSKSKTLCADSNLTPILEASGRLENRKSAEWMRNWGGSKSYGSALWSLRE
ncbi:hypothetical protein AVEN_99421-1, partial [Araneus ventricosus]